MSDNKLTVEVLVRTKDKYMTETLTYCAFCGQEYPLDDESATLIAEHIRTCDKHPMRESEATATRRLELLRRTSDWFKANYSYISDDEEAMKLWEDIDNELDKELKDGSKS